jgi:hypothetical protein
VAGDWIKMRVNLVSHPKVLAISEFLAGHGKYQDWSTMAGFVPAIGGTAEDAEEDFQSSLRVTRYVTVCALLRFWGYANEHAKDEFIGSLRIGDIDDIVQVPGFGDALQVIGWAVYDKTRRGIALPDFNEYNSSANDRGAAERQKRYRERKKAATSQATGTSDVTSDVTRHDREEKRREDINTGAKAPKRKSQIPEDFAPNENGIAAAKNAGLLVEQEIEQFRNHHKAKGTTMLDWQAAWRTWVGMAVQFGRGGKADSDPYGLAGAI